VHYSPREIADLLEAVPELQKADSSIIDMKEWQHHFEQQQQQNAQNNGKASTKEGSGSNSDETSEAESQVTDTFIQMRTYTCTPDREREQKTNPPVRACIRAQRMMKSEHPPGARDFFPFVSLSLLGGEKRERLIRSPCKLAQFCCVSLAL
jgi:hypothetical protein